MTRDQGSERDKRDKLPLDSEEALRTLPAVNPESEPADRPEGKDADGDESEDDS